MESQSAEKAWVQPFSAGPMGRAFHASPFLRAEQGLQGACGLLSVLMQFLSALTHITGGGETHGVITFPEVPGAVARGAFSGAQSSVTQDMIRFFLWEITEEERKWN